MNLKKVREWWNRQALDTFGELVEPKTPEEVPPMIPWVRRFYGPIPDGGFLHPQGGMNRAQRRAYHRTNQTRAQRMQARRALHARRSSWAPTRKEHHGHTNEG